MPRVWTTAGALIFFAVCGSACYKPDAPAKKRTASGPLQPCKLPGIREELLCGKLKVFENRATSTGRTIDLNVVVVPAIDPAPGETPLFDLAGGPGAASPGGPGFYTQDGTEYRRSRCGPEDGRAQQLKSIGAPKTRSHGLSDRDVRSNSKTCAGPGTTG